MPHKLAYAATRKRQKIMFRELVVAFLFLDNN
jgi:hypothetical protein